MSNQSDQKSRWVESSFGDLVPTKPKNSTKRNSSSSKFSTTASSTSKWPIPAGKRKIESSVGDQTKSISSSSSSKSIETTSFQRPPNKIPRRQPSTIVQQQQQRNSDKLNLVERYSPKSVDDLAIHSKKLKELRDWFGARSSTTTSTKGISFLVINGPSGCGKLSAIRTIGRELGMDAEEWKEPQLWREWRRFDPDDRESRLEIIRASQLDEFSTFLIRSTIIETSGLIVIGDRSDGASAQSSSSPSPSRVKLIVAKDFPTEFYEKSNEFATILQNFQRKASRKCRALIVFIVSTSSGGSTGYSTDWKRLFPQQLLDQLRIDTIEFNAIAPTFLGKALRRVIDAEQMDIPKTQLDQMVETSNGDIRFALNELQFLHSGRKYSLSSRNSKSTATKASARDTALLLFRAVGRCMYSKRKDGGGASGGNEIVELDPADDLLPAHLRSSSPTYSRPIALDFDPDTIVEETGFQPSMFVLFLEENMWDAFAAPVPTIRGAIGGGEISSQESDELGAIASTLEMFSLVDTIANTQDYESRDKLAVYEKSLPSRAVAFYAYENSRRSKGSRTFKSMRRPKWLDTSRKLRTFGGGNIPRQPAIMVARNGTVSISEYVPFDHQQSKNAQWYKSGGGKSQSVESESLEDGDDLDEECPAKSRVSGDRSDQAISTGYTITQEEMSKISIDEFDD